MRILDYKSNDLPDDTALPLAMVYRCFESLGNNCEFGIVQRAAGCDPPGLFRNVGFLHIEQMISAIVESVAGMFVDGNFDFALADGFPSWLLTCFQYDFVFHTTIDRKLKPGLEGWNAETERAIKVFRFLKAKFMEDLLDGQKIFVFKTVQAISDAEIFRLHSALQKHGENALFVVRQDQSKKAGTVEYCGRGLILGFTDQLSNQNPPTINYPIWETMCRDLVRSQRQIWSRVLPILP